MAGEEKASGDTGVSVDGDVSGGDSGRGVETGQDSVGADEAMDTAALVDAEVWEVAEHDFAVRIHLSEQAHDNKVRIPVAFEATATSFKKNINGERRMGLGEHVIGTIVIYSTRACKKVTQANTSFVKKNYGGCSL